MPRLVAIAMWPADTGTLYYSLATGFLHEHRPVLNGAVTTFIEPFYSLCLAAVRGATGDRLLALLIVQIAFASLGGVLLYRLTLERTSRRTAAWAAALLYAASPYLVRQSVAFMEITPSVVVLIALCLAANPPITTSGRAIAVGLLAGVTLLTRFSFLPMAVGAVALTAVRGGVSRGVMATAAAALLVGPWMAVSRSIDGTYLPPRIGENLFVSTSEWAEGVVPWTNVDALVPQMDERVAAAFAARGISRPTRGERDALLTRWAWQFVRDHPARAARLKLRNLAYVLQPRLLPFASQVSSAVLVDGRLVVPEQPRRPLGFEIVAAIFQTVLIAAGAAGLWARRRHLLHGDSLLVLVLVSVVAMNVAFFPTSRLLAPLTFVLMFYAGAAVAR